MRAGRASLEHHYLLTFFEKCVQDKFSYEEALQASVMRMVNTSKTPSRSLQ